MEEKPKTIDDKIDFIIETLDAMFDMLMDVAWGRQRFSEYDEKRLTGMMDTLKTLKQETKNDENQNL